MKSASRVAWGAIALQAVVAGIAGGATIALYLWITTLLPHHASLGTWFAWIASTALGKAALADSASVWTGAALHAGVSIAWAGGYAYLAATRPATTRRWLVAGIVYGLIVYTIMQVILLADDNFTYPPTPNAFLNALVAHAAFFGLPVAYVVKTLRSRSPL